MLFRFSLYGFLKNQRYFEPFLILAFLDKGLSFFEIGLLVGFRELTIFVLEVPSGAIADVCGRRGSMVLAFAAYIVSFVVFGFAEDISLLFVAMGLFAIGETFRSGTHKALIFTWLRQQGRIDDRAQVYGYTRSWSKFGSALSVVIAAVLVFTTERYSDVFFYSTIPYMFGIINLATYPKSLEPKREGRASIGQVWRHLTETLRESIHKRPLRRLMAESMAFEGVFHAAKDYLQPVLAAASVVALSRWSANDSLSDIQSTALFVGPVYVVLYVLSGVASRAAHRVSAKAGSDEAAARWLWFAAIGVYGTVLAAGYFDVAGALIVALVALHVAQNMWRPLLISRFDAHSAEHQGATMLSIESQARRLATMVIAPLLGLAVDYVDGHGPGGSFWPIGVLGAALAVGMASTAKPLDSR